MAFGAEMQLGLGQVADPDPISDAPGIRVTGEYQKTTLFSV
jgi:hypothetical protein